ncbi:MAG: hypothetical protein KGH63_01030 [Candidatus Micrarchaeota archaeon]|nr:hypothetical protein [Candidatus Micrarchaeota archaeon]
MMLFQATAQKTAPPSSTRLDVTEHKDYSESAALIDRYGHVIARAEITDGRAHFSTKDIKRVSSPQEDTEVDGARKTQYEKIKVSDKPADDFIVSTTMRGVDQFQLVGQGYQNADPAKGQVRPPLITGHQGIGFLNTFTDDYKNDAGLKVSKEWLRNIGFDIRIENNKIGVTPFGMNWNPSRKVETDLQEVSPVVALHDRALQPDGSLDPELAALPFGQRMAVDFNQSQGLLYLSIENGQIPNDGVWRTPIYAAGADPSSVVGGALDQSIIPARNMPVVMAALAHSKDDIDPVTHDHRGERYFLIYPVQAYGSQSEVANRLELVAVPMTNTSPEGVTYTLTGQYELEDPGNNNAVVGWARWEPRDPNATFSQDDFRSADPRDRYDKYVVSMTPNMDLLASKKQRARYGQYLITNDGGAFDTPNPWSMTDEYGAIGRKGTGQPPEYDPVIFQTGGYDKLDYSAVLDRTSQLYRDRIKEILGQTPALPPLPGEKVSNAELASYRRIDPRALTFTLGPAKEDDDGNRLTLSVRQNKDGSYYLAEPVHGQMIAPLIQLPNGAYDYGDPAEIVRRVNLYVDPAFYDDSSLVIKSKPKRKTKKVTNNLDEN